METRTMIFFHSICLYFIAKYMDCIHAVSPEPSLLAHISSESRGTFRQKARSLAPLNAGHA